MPTARPPPPTTHRRRLSSLGLDRSSAPGRSPRWSAPSRPRPASLRTRDSPFGAWITLGACATLPAIAAVALARAAREGARTVSGPDASLATWGVATWAMATFLALASLGAFLRATTHHHGLAGVTFAIGGLAVGGALALVVRRLMQMARGADPGGARRSW